MLSLDARELPSTRQQLESAIVGSLRQLFVLPENRWPIAVQGGEYPAFENVTIDISGAQASTTEPPTAPQGTGDIRPGPSVDHFNLIGRPIRVDQASLDLSIEARDARFNFDRAPDGRLILLLVQTTDGLLEARVSRMDLEHLLLSLADAAASRHGVSVSDVRLQLQSVNPRSLSLQAEVTVRKFVKAVITISCKISIDEDLTLLMQDLRCEGEGMLGSLACRLLQPHLQRLEQRPIPLTAFSLRQMQVRDLRIALHNDAIRITASFAS